MDKAEFQRLTNEARGQPLRMEGFEHLIPGWTNRVAHPYNLLIEAGIRSEVARLTGKRYLVAVLHREYDLDGLFEQVFFEDAFTDLMEAVAHAEAVQGRHIAHTLSEHPNWHDLGAPRHQWPAGEGAGGKVRRLTAQKVGDGTGFNSREVYVAVLPVDPEQPLSARVFQILGQTSVLNAFFRKVGGG